MMSKIFSVLVLLFTLNANAESLVIYEAKHPYKIDNMAFEFQKSADQKKAYIGVSVSDPTSAGGTDQGYRYWDEKIRLKGLKIRPIFQGSEVSVYTYFDGMNIAKCGYLIPVDYGIYTDYRFIATGDCYFTVQEVSRNIELINEDGEKVVRSEVVSQLFFNYETYKSKNLKK